MAKDKPTLEVFQGRDGRWYWRCRSPHGGIYAVGGQGFPTRKVARAEAMVAAQLLPRAARDA